MSAVRARARFLGLGLLSLVLGLSAVPVLAQTCRVTSVLDGDTVRCWAGWRELTVRLGQIDAPEKDQPYGRQAQAVLAGKVLARSVVLSQAETDKYGRTVAQLALDGRDINREMVQQGWAWAYRQYLHDRSYLQAEQAARAARSGLWADARPVEPSQWRRGGRTGKPVGEALPPVTQAPAGVWQCGSKTRCSQMQSCDEARFYLQQCSVKRLDANGDGEPCESLCRPSR